MLTIGLFSSIKDDWCTPRYIFDQLNDLYHFNIDLCANDSNHLCDEYYTIDNSCFNLHCSGKSIFCNPPYGRTIRSFIQKCYDLSLEGNTVVALLPSRTDTKWFHQFIYHSADIIFLYGRLKFSGSKNSAPFPSMIVRWYPYGKKS